MHPTNFCLLIIQSISPNLKARCLVRILITFSVNVCALNFGS